MSTSTKVRTGQEVISAMMSADTPSLKAKATKLQKEYIAQRVAEGKDAKKVQAGLISRVNRLQNEQKAAAAARKPTTVKAKATTATKTTAAPASPAATRSKVKAKARAAKK